MTKADRNDLTWEESRGVCAATMRPLAGPPLIRCELPAGHSEAHEGSSHGIFAKWATDEQAEPSNCTCPANIMYVADDCPVHGPDALPHLYPTRCDAIHQQGRCMREAGHDGLHSVTVEDNRTGSHVVEWAEPRRKAAR